MDFSVGNKFIGIGYNYAMKKTKKKKKPNFTIILFIICEKQNSTIYSQIDSRNTICKLNYAYFNQNF